MGITLKKEKISLPLNSILQGDTISMMKQLPSNSIDLIFADPPYDFETTEFIKIVDLVFEQNLLSQEGTLVIEHSKHTDLQEHPLCFETRKYGGSVFSFFSKKDS